MRSKLLVTTLVLAGVMMLAGCTNSGTDDNSEVMPADPDVVEMEANGDSEPIPGAEDKEMMDDSKAMDESMGTVREYSMEMANYSFTPDSIPASPGDTVRISFTAVEGMHDFVIDELDVQTEIIEAGEGTVVEFTVPEDAAGQEYEFYCSVGEHRALGMVGTLVVSD